MTEQKREVIVGSKWRMKRGPGMTGKELEMRKIYVVTVADGDRSVTVNEGEEDYTTFKWTSFSACCEWVSDPIPEVGSVWRINAEKLLGSGARPLKDTYAVTGTSPDSEGKQCVALKTEDGFGTREPLAKFVKYYDLVKAAPFPVAVAPAAPPLFVPKPGERVRIIKVADFANHSDGTIKAGAVLTVAEASKHDYASGMVQLELGPESVCLFVEENGGGSGRGGGAYVICEPCSVPARKVGQVWRGKGTGTLFNIERVMADGSVKFEDYPYTKHGDTADTFDAKRPLYTFVSDVKPAPAKQVRYLASIGRCCTSFAKSKGFEVGAAVVELEKDKLRLFGAPDSAAEVFCYELTDVEPAKVKAEPKAEPKAAPAPVAKPAGEMPQKGDFVRVTKVAPKRPAYCRPNLVDGEILQLTDRCFNSSTHPGYLKIDGVTSAGEKQEGWGLVEKVGGFDPAYGTFSSARVQITIGDTSLDPWRAYMAAIRASSKPSPNADARLDYARLALGPNAKVLLADLAERLAKGAKEHGDFATPRKAASWMRERHEEDLDGIVYGELAVKAKAKERAQGYNVLAYYNY